MFRHPAIFWSVFLFMTALFAAEVFQLPELTPEARASVAELYDQECYACHRWKRNFAGECGTLLGQSQRSFRLSQRSTTNPPGQVSPDGNQEALRQGRFSDGCMADFARQRFLGDGSTKISYI